MNYKLLFFLMMSIFLVGCYRDPTNSYTETIENATIYKVERGEWGYWIDGDIGFWVFYDKERCWAPSEDKEMLREMIECNCKKNATLDIYAPSGYKICRIKQIN